MIDVTEAPSTSSEQHDRASQASSGCASIPAWPRRLAIALVCVVFPLIWVGGLVTSYNAGMAVPDWPNTYGYNLFLYPWTTWLFGPWDLFIEHGHRLLGALAGMVTIALVVAAWRSRTTWAFRWATVAALVMVIGQGALGGARVLLNERQLAMIHGCTGPLFFAFCVGLAAASSRWWAACCAPSLGSKAPLGGDGGASLRTDRLRRAAFITLAIAYLQLVLGAQLRHAPVMLAPDTFRVLVFAHLLGAAALAAHIGWTYVLVRMNWRGDALIRRPATILLVLIVTQLVLGAVTWVVNYSWPDWMRMGSHGAGYTIVAEGWLQSNITTAHVAMGSLLLGFCTQLALRAWRVGAVSPLLGGIALGGAALGEVANATLWKGATT